MKKKVPKFRVGDSVFVKDYNWVDSRQGEITEDRGNGWWSVKITYEKYRRYPSNIGRDLTFIKLCRTSQLTLNRYSDGLDNWI